MIGENINQKNRTLICNQCNRELEKNYCYCSGCMSQAATWAINRFIETSTLDQLHQRTKFIEGRLESIEETMEKLIIELKENLIQQKKRKYPDKMQRRIEENAVKS